MPCSAVTLSLATVVSVVAVALLGISFGTDNWNYYAVRRDEVQASILKKIRYLYDYSRPK